MFDEFSLRFERFGADEAALLLVGVIDADVVSEVLDRLDEDDGAVAETKSGYEAAKGSCTLSAGKDVSDTQSEKMVVEPKCGSETPCYQRASEKRASTDECGGTETV